MIGKIFLNSSCTPSYKIIVSTPSGKFTHKTGARGKHQPVGRLGEGGSIVIGISNSDIDHSSRHWFSTGTSHHCGATDNALKSLITQQCSYYTYQWKGLRPKKSKQNSNWHCKNVFKSGKQNTYNKTQL